MDQSKVLAVGAGAAVGLLGLLYLQFKSSKSGSQDGESESKAAPVETTPADLVVVGSANVDIYIDVKDIPRKGETVDGSVTTVGPGGKGSNQAAAAAKALQNTNKSVAFIGHLGSDAHADMFLKAYSEIGVKSHLVDKLNQVPTGQAFIILDSQSENSIIIALGANDVWGGSPSSFTDEDFRALVKDPASAPCLSRAPLTLQQIKAVLNASIVMLQREIPDDVNLFIAKLVHAAREANPSSNKLTMLDMGGRATPLPEEILPYLSVLSLNETELSRLTGIDVTIAPVDVDDIDESFHIATHHMPIATDRILQACAKLVQNGTRSIMITLGANGALLVARRGDRLTSAASSVDEHNNGVTILAYTPAFKPVPALKDTTGAGDCFRGNFAAALLQGYNATDALRFAAAASAICVGTKGTLPSMPWGAETIRLMKEQRE